MALSQQMAWRRKATTRGRTSVEERACGSPTTTRPIIASRSASSRSSKLSLAAQWTVSWMSWLSKKKIAELFFPGVLAKLGLDGAIEQAQGAQGDPKPATPAVNPQPLPVAPKPATPAVHPPQSATPAVNPQLLPVFPRPSAATPQKQRAGGGRGKKETSPGTAAAKKRGRPPSRDLLKEVEELETRFFSAPKTDALLWGVEQNTQLAICQDLSVSKRAYWCWFEKQCYAKQQF